MRDVVEVVGRDWAGFIKRLRDLECRSCKQICSGLVPDGPTCVQDVSLKASLADYRGGRVLAEGRAINHDLCGIEEIPVDIDADLDGKIKEAETLRIRLEWLQSS